MSKDYGKYLDALQIFVAGSVLLLYVVGLSAFTFVFMSSFGHRAQSLAVALLP